MSRKHIRIEMTDGPLWVPNDPDEAVRIVYENLHVDIPRKAVEACRKALEAVPLEGRCALKVRMVVRIKAFRCIAASETPSNTQIMDFARAMMWWYVCDAMDKAQGDQPGGA